MGLSASQARLLTITARKADCEFQSMMLSHQKIALSRDMEKISNEYQSALAQTKLVYDYYGTGASTMDLSYGLLMTPSMYNDYYPRLVTDSTNRVILSSPYAAAARAAGIPIEGLSGTPSSDIRNAFMEALGANDVLKASEVTDITSTVYGNTVGLGTTINVTTIDTYTSFEELLDLLRSYSETSSQYGVPLGRSGLGEGEKAAKQTMYPDMGGEETLTVFHGGIQESDVSDSINLADLLTNDNQYVLSMESRDGEQSPISCMQFLQSKLSEASDFSFLSWISDQLIGVLGDTNEIVMAAQYAQDSMQNLINPGNNALQKEVAQSGSDLWNHSTITEYGNPTATRNMLNEFGAYTRTISLDWDHLSYQELVEKDALDYVGFAYSGGYNLLFVAEDKNDSACAISLNNLAQAYMTYFVEQLKLSQGETSNYNVAKMGSKKDESVLYDPAQSDFKFPGQSGQVSSDGGNEVMSEFYDAIFNLICMRGWVENDKIDDTQYLQEMLKNGMVFISSIKNDGYYYQGNYKTDSYISEIADNTAIAQAEAKYNTAKAKIEDKENTIDMKIKNLDTEISSLSQEYDSTKNIISKAISNSFKRYDA